MNRSQLSRSVLALLAALALFATACGGSSAEVATSTSSASTPADNPAAAPEAEAPAPEAPEAAPEAEAAEPAISLVASTTTGGQIDFGSLAGQDVVLWFWAPW